MEVDYASALQQLEAMFPNFDDETFRTVLASNDGHLERTIEDLIKLANEVENAPDDDENLFAEPTRKNVSNVYNDPGYQSNRHAKESQESADAKMAYELQMQYLQENQNAGGVNQHHNQNQQYNPPAYQSNGGGSYGSHNVAGSYDGIQGFHPVDAPHQNDPVKKKGFYKKLKLSVKNMLSRKGKGGKKGPTRNPGLYAEMDENLNPNNPLEDEPDMFKVKEDDDNEPAMKLSDIMNKPNNAEDNYSPRDEYIKQRSYDNNNNDRYGKNQNRNDYNQRAEYPPVNRHNENEYYSDYYYEQH